MKALINATIYDFETYKENAYILFDKEIKKVGNMSEFNGADEVIDAKGMLVMPGLSVGHTHIYSTFARGMSVPFNPKSFKDILEQLWWKLDSKLDNEANYISGLVSGVEFVKNGVTSIIDHHASGMDIKGSLHSLKKAVSDEIGIRGIYCFETSDRFNLKECIDENIEFAKSRTEKSAGIFGMHASLSLSNNSLELISKRFNGLPIHIHVAESLEDELDSIKKHGLNVVKRLESHGLITKNSILAHCVHIQEEEAQIISKNEAYIAINTTSNLNNAVGIPDYSLFKRNKIKTLIGNDGLGYNITRDYLNTFFAMKNRLGNTMNFGFEDLLNLINNNYDYIGKTLGVKIGKIREGYQADIITVPYISPTPINDLNAFGHIIFGVFDNFNPRDTICQGEFLMKNRILKADVEGIYTEAKRVSQRVWDSLGG